MIILFYFVFLRFFTAHVASKLPGQEYYDDGYCCTRCKKPVVCETPKCLYVAVSTYPHMGEKSLNMMPCLINLYGASYEAF